MIVNRRELFQFALLTATAARANSTGPSLQFPSDPRMRLAVTSYPFRASIESPTNSERNPKLPPMDMTAFPQFVVEHFGVYNVNPLLAHFRSTEPGYLEAFRQALVKVHSHIVDLGLGGAHFYAADASVRQKAVDFGRRGVDAASQVGSPSVRQHVGGDSKPDVSRAAESLSQLADYGAKRNVVINLENDNPGAEDPFFLVAVIEKVNNPYLRALPDFGNSLAGHDNAYNAKAVAAMLRHAFDMCHVKDTVVEGNGKRSQVDLPAMFALAKQSGFRGYFSMEYETQAGDPIAGTKQLVQESLRCLS